MMFEIDGDQMHFQVITDQGKTVDSGIITRRRVDDKAAPSVPAAPPAKPVPPQDKPDIDGEAGRPVDREAGRACDGEATRRRELSSTMTLTRGQHFGRRGSHRFVVPDESTGFLRFVRPEILGPPEADHLKPQLGVDLERAVRLRRRRSRSARDRLPPRKSASCAAAPTTAIHGSAVALSKPRGSSRLSLT